MKNLLKAIMDLVYPQSLYCNCCGNLIDETREYHLCDHCIRHIRWSIDEPKELDNIKIFRCTEYGIYERTLIFSLKYSGKKYIARDIGKIIADRLSLENLDYNLIIPIPMYKAKERKRGFNHAALISRYLSEEVYVPWSDKCLIRAVDTKPMRGLSPREREENIKNSFQINEKCAKMLQGKSILIIDDFFTTGSTVKEAVRILKESGVAGISFIAFAAKY